MRYANAETEITSWIFCLSNQCATDSNHRFVNFSYSLSALFSRNQEFDERAHNYRRKKWILDGLDPDEMENKWKQEQKSKQKQRKKVHKETMKKKEETMTASTSANDGICLLNK